MRIGDLVRIEWLDATGPVDLWPGEDLDVATTWTVGIVRDLNERRVVLAPEWFEDSDMQKRACSAIPRISITKVKVLGVK